jgi:hypothetical protein
MLKYQVRAKAKPDSRLIFFELFFQQLELAPYLLPLNFSSLQLLALPLEFRFFFVQL